MHTVSMMIPIDNVFCHNELSIIVSSVYYNILINVMQLLSLLQYWIKLVFVRAWLVNEVCLHFFRFFHSVTPNPITDNPIFPQICRSDTWYSDGPVKKGRLVNNYSPITSLFSFWVEAWCTRRYTINNKNTRSSITWVIAGALASTGVVTEHQHASITPWTLSKAVRQKYIGTRTVAGTKKSRNTFKNRWTRINVKVR